jgi:flagellar basal-body rod protein FlgG
MSLGIQIGIAQFSNPSGLLKTSNSLLRETEASGMAKLEAEDSSLQQSTIRQRYLEASNVQTVDEMVNLIVAQRAYEMNSKIITAADEMLQQANNLR